MKKQKNKGMRRALHLLLALVMLAGIFPVGAMAAEYPYALPPLLNEYAYDIYDINETEPENYIYGESEDFASGGYQPIDPFGPVIIKPFPCDCTRFDKRYDAEIPCDCTNPNAAFPLMNAHWSIDGENPTARTFPKNWVFICDTYLNNRPNHPPIRDVYVHWPIVPGFTVELIGKSNHVRMDPNEWLHPQFFPMGTGSYAHPDRLSRNLDTHFYISAPGAPNHLPNYSWAHLVANIRTRATSVQLQTRDLHLNYESGQENVGLRTNAVAGAYANDIEDHFTHNAQIENRTFSAPALNLINGTWIDGFPQSAAPLTLKIPALPNGERAFEFYFECPNNPGTWIQSYDFTTGVLGGLNEGYCYNIRHIFDSLPIRPKADLPAGVHQTDVRIYQRGWVWDGPAPQFGVPPEDPPELKYVWLGAVPIPGSSHVLLNPDNGQFRVTFEVDPCPQGQLTSDVSIEKASDADDPVRAGGRVTYTISVTNDGPGVANNVVVTDALPAGLRFEHAEIVYPYPTPAGANVSFSLSNRTLTVTIPTLAPDAIVEIEVEVTVIQTTAGAITNKAYVTVNGEPADDDDTTINVIPPGEPQPGVTIVKTVSPGSVAAGGNVNYTLVITNTGEVPLTSLTVTDILPTQLTNPRNLVIPYGATNYGFDGQTLSVTLAELAPKASVTITFTATVVAGTPANTQIANTATVVDEETDVSASDSATVTVIQGIVDPPPNGGVSQPPTQQPPVEYPDPEPPLAEMSPYHHAYIIGYPDGYVRPGSNITRAEVATIFFRLISDEHRVNIWSQTNPFPDVILQDWFNNAISTLTNANLLYGYPDGYFRPNQSMTRAEFAAVIVRIMGGRNAMNTISSPFTDVSGHWGEAYINVAYSLGWVRGYLDGTFRPDQFITRAEVAALVNRALNRLPESPDDLLPGMVVWPDNMDVNAWYYLYIQEATNSHYHEMKDNGVNETWTELITPREWWRLERPNSNPEIFTGLYIGEGMGMIED